MLFFHVLLANYLHCAFPIPARRTWPKQVQMLCSLPPPALTRKASAAAREPTVLLPSEPLPRRAAKRQAKADTAPRSSFPEKAQYLNSKGKLCRHQWKYLIRHQIQPAWPLQTGSINTGNFPFPRTCTALPKGCKCSLRQHQQFGVFQGA